MTYTLDEHVQRDPRILSVYQAARRLYGKNNFYHHNIDHISRNLYRSFLIAVDEQSVDYSVLIPSVLLHDVGFSHPDCRRLGHDAAGAQLAEELLTEIGYGKEMIQAICHCIRAHKGGAELPQSLEAKILYDADVLEKSGLVYLILAGKIVCEFGETIADFLRRESPARAFEVERGFYTQKARQLDGGRLEQVASLLSQIQNEIVETRPDFGITEQDLWVEPPTEAST
jgi:uncharacterized protein